MKKEVATVGDVKFPIGVKLAIIIGFIVLVSLGAVTILNSHFVGQDVKITAENQNLSINTSNASIVEDKFSTVRSNVFQLLDLLSVATGGRTSAFAKQAEVFFFERNQDISSIHILSADSNLVQNNSDVKIINNRFFISNELDTSCVDSFISSINTEISRSCVGEIIALNASPYFGIPMISMLFPYKESGRDQTCIITFSIESISEILGTNSINTTFIINDSDDLLYHPETSRILNGENIKNDELIQAMRLNNQNNDDSRQIPYDVIDEKGKSKSYYGAYEKLSFGDIVILTTVPFDTILEGVRTTRRNNIYLTAAVFFLSIMFILIFSRYGISLHLRKLTGIADEIQKGNFDTPLFDELNVNRKDEIGVLNQSSKDERDFLQTFAKFTNKGVAKAIARKEIDFEPHLKDVTIFFSDIRGFTAISDGFKIDLKTILQKKLLDF